LSKLDDLCRRSIEIIKNNQSDFGLYEASPNFKNYKYCWSRDGTFIAYSMDITKNIDSSSKFYTGINKIVKNNKDKINRSIEEYKNNGVIDKKNMLPVRFTMTGEDTNTDWEEFQLDGWGTWLWGLCRHLEFSGELELTESKFKDSIDLLILYLKTFWQQPNFDCWEEQGNRIHPSSIACIYGGLNSIGNLRQDSEILKICGQIKDFVVNSCVNGSYFVKYVGSQEVDASLLWLSTPFEMFSTSDNLMKGTINKIEEDLFKGGLKRYRNDEYYGGGSWPLLTACLGWHYFKMGKLSAAAEMLENISKCSDEDFNLPEQVPEWLNYTSKYKYWKKKWGDIAKPLLWSHAMYLILYSILDKGEPLGK
jgi:GH15 family glucan-1,4-alpha-glucosidase